MNYDLVWRSSEQNQCRARGHARLIGVFAQLCPGSDGGAEEERAYRWQDKGGKIE